MAIVLVALGVTLYLQNRHTPGTGRFFDPVLPAMALTFPATAALVASRGGRSPVTWLFSAAGVSAVSFFAEQYAVYALIANPGRLPAGEWAAWLATWSWAPAYLGVFTLLPLLFPDGRVTAPGWRPLLWAAAAAIAVTAVFLALAPENLTSPAVHNPMGVRGVPAWGGIGLAVSMFVLAPLAVVSLISRYRRAQGVARRQLSGVTLAFVVAVAVPLAALGLEVAGVTIPVGLYQAMGLVGVVAMAGAPVVAAVRHGLYDFGLSVNTVVGRVLVYAALGAVVAITYGALTALLTALLPGHDLLAAAALAVLVAAAVGRGLHPGFQRRIDRFLYRKRDYDYAVLASLGPRLRSTLGPDAALPVIAETVGSALKLPYVNLTVGRGEEVAASATYGALRHDALVLPLVHQGEQVGRLTVACQESSQSFDDADRRLLDELASQAAIVAYALCLAADLQRSRERLVVAREEERRRLRRDLHDGLKPTLAGVALGLDAVRNIVAHDPETAGSLLVRLRSELEGAGGDIRRLVNDLRPPALDELGLVGALRQHASRFQLFPTTPDVVLDAPELPALPAAVEVAVYRIAQEALENVRTHAHANSCAISLNLDDGHLQLEVCDDGAGFAPDYRPGVGLLAMQERAAELGGSCIIEAVAGAGICVRARLPLDVP